MERVERVEKPKDYGKVMRGIFSYLKPMKGQLVLALVLMLTASGLILLGPYFSGRAVDYMGPGGSMNGVVKFALLMAGTYIVSAILNYIFMRLVNRISENASGHMRRDTFNKILDLPLAYIDSHHAGDLVSRISYDLSLVKQSIQSHFFQVLASMIGVLGSLFMMIRIAPRLALVFVVLLPITVVFTIYRVKKTRPLFSKRSKLLGNMNAYVEEVLYGHDTIAAYGKEDYFSHEFKEVNKGSMAAYYRADYQAALNGPSISLITNLSLAFIAVFGGAMYINGNVGLGTLAAFILYSRRFSGPINQIAQIVAEVQSALSAGERVFNLLDEEEEKKDAQGAKDLDTKSTRIEFKNVDFSYDGEERVIKNFDLVAEEGKLTAIVGPTGSGKSTLMNLLMRYYDPDSGRILIGDQDIQKVKRRSLRRSFAMVDQDSWLFQGSLWDNIAYGTSLNKDEMDALVDDAGLRDLVDSLPEGLDTLITDGGANLSQGQRQMVSIARAMALKSPMLILDEATSNVDTKTEHKIQEAMNRLTQNRTAIVIAHRLSTIENADKIVVLVGGEKMEEGNHQELLDKKGFYADLYMSQFI